jgi:hypothetical protein
MTVQKWRGRSGWQHGLGVGLIAISLAYSGGAFAQLLLKPGQGLVGAPEPLPPEPPKKQDPEVKELDGVTVRGQKDPLSEADRKRREQAKKLPGLGSEQERQQDRLDKLRAWYSTLPKDPNDLSPDAQQFLEQTTRAPDVNHVGQYKTEPRRDSADYKDPFAKASKTP